MIYSVFVPAEGLYHYYESPQALEFNADLPVPGLPSDSGKVGVPSIDAARPLPAGTRMVGKGWKARGMVATTRPASLTGIGSFFGPGDPPYGALALSALAGALIGSWSASHYAAAPRKAGAAAGTVGALVGCAMGVWVTKRVA